MTTKKITVGLALQWKRDTPPQPPRLQTEGHEQSTYPEMEESHLPLAHHMARFDTYELGHGVAYGKRIPQKETKYPSTSASLFYIFHTKHGTHLSPTTAIVNSNGRLQFVLRYGAQCQSENHGITAHSSRL